MYPKLITIKKIPEKLLYEMIEDFKDNDDTKDYDFFGDSYGIYYKDKLIGLINLSSMFDNLSITIAIKKEYRGNGFASIAVNELVENFGKDYPEIEKFIYNVSTNNISSNKAAKKLNWKETSEYDEVMLDEGGQFFNIFYKINPYFKKTPKL